MRHSGRAVPLLGIFAARSATMRFSLSYKGESLGFSKLGAITALVLRQIHLRKPSQPEQLTASM